MRVVEHSSASVEDILSELEAAYSSFPVNQTTVAVPTEQYEAVRASEAGYLDLYATVRNESSEVLHIDTEGGRTLPGTSVSGDSELERQLRMTVRNEAGVECRLDGIAEVRIVGIREESTDADETLYRLAVVFEAEYRDGSPAESAIWLEDVQGLPVRAD